jgi:hypothetical protein
MKRTAQPSPSGYAAPLAEALTGYAHADGSLSIERQDGAALDLDPAATAALYNLLRAAGPLRTAAARRRARIAYTARYSSQDTPDAIEHHSPHARRPFVHDPT